MSSARRRSTRDEILAAAERLLKESGPAVTLEEIAEDAGVSRQTLYLHFGSRAGVLIAMVQWIDSRGRLPALIEGVFGSPTAPEALDAIARLHAEYYPLIYPVARAFLRGRHDDDAIRLAWDERMDSRRNLYRQVVERLDRDGALAAAWDVEEATDLLWSITSWEVWEQLVLGRGWSNERYRNHLCTLLHRTLIDEGKITSGAAKKPRPRKPRKIR